jgi:hypothetical protein
MQSDGVFIQLFRQNIYFEISPQRLLRIFFKQVTEGAHLNSQVFWQLKHLKSYRKDGETPYGGRRR